jgi:hypothetical protein
MKLEVPVDIQSLTLYALDMVKAESSPVEIILGANKREIFALARANIQSYGKDTALQNVPKTINPIEIKRVEEHVRSVFPEIN